MWSQLYGKNYWRELWKTATVVECQVQLVHIRTELITTAERLNGRFNYIIMGFMLNLSQSPVWHCWLLGKEVEIFRKICVANGIRDWTEEWQLFPQTTPSKAYLYLARIVKLGKEMIDIHWTTPCCSTHAIGTVGAFDVIISHGLGHQTQINPFLHRSLGYEANIGFWKCWRLVLLG